MFEGVNAAEARAFAERWLPAWTGNRPELLASFYTDDAFYSDPTRPRGISGKTGLLGYFRRLLAANPHRVWTPTRSAPMQDGFVNYWHLRAPVAGETVEVDGVCLVRLRDGRIYRNEVYFDCQAFLDATRARNGRGATGGGLSQGERALGVRQSDGALDSAGRRSIGRVTPMTISGLDRLGLTVRAVDQSAVWYESVLGFHRVGQFVAPGGERRKIFLRHADLDVRIGLTEHRSGSHEAFDETRVGLDHLAFRVASHAELVDWQARLADLDVAHTPIASANSIPGAAVLVFRDPDSIQLELFFDPTGDAR